MLEFARTVQRLRKEKGYTLEKLADKVGVVKSYLSKLENDRVNTQPSEKFLKKLANELGIEFEKLTLLAGKLTRGMINDLDLQKIEIFRSMYGKKYTDEEFRNILKQVKKNDD